MGPKSSSTYHTAGKSKPQSSNQRIFYMVYILNLAGYFKPAIRLSHKAVFIEKKAPYERFMQRKLLCVPFPRITLFCELYVYYPTQKAPGEYICRSSFHTTIDWSSKRVH